ncbi:MAG: 50S ribosomal protein L33, partial [Elusimicrobiota bacterium]
ASPCAKAAIRSAPASWPTSSPKTMGDRYIVVLGCTACKNKNYTFQRGKKKEFKLDIKKFCRKCGKQVSHKEVK